MVVLGNSDNFRSHRMPRVLGYLVGLLDCRTYVLDLSLVVLLVTSIAEIML